MNLLVEQVGTILSFAKTLKKRNINYQNSLLVEATDISDVCVYMTYIQLALYGIPAVVCCGNALTKEVRFKMETPLFFLNYYKFRSFYMHEKAEKDTVKENTITINKPITEFKEVTVNGNCQISLW